MVLTHGCLLTHSTGLNLFVGDAQLACGPWQEGKDFFINSYQLFLQVGEKCWSGKILAGNSPIFFSTLNNSRVRSSHGEGNDPPTPMFKRHSTAPPQKDLE